MSFAGKNDKGRLLKNISVDIVFLDKLPTLRSIKQNIRESFPKTIWHLLNSYCKRVLTEWLKIRK